MINLVQTSQQILQVNLLGKFAMEDVLDQGGEVVFLISLDIAKALCQKWTLFTFPVTSIDRAAEKLYLCDNGRGHMLLCFSLSLFLILFFFNFKIHFIA